MNVSLEKKEDLTGLLAINLEPTDYMPSVDKKLKDYSKRVQMPGFRPGKVPAGLVQKMYGKSVVMEEVNSLINDAMTNYFAENQINTLGRPILNEEKTSEINLDNFDFKKAESFQFCFDVGLAPEITFSLKDFAAETFTISELEVDEETIQENMKALQERFGEQTPSESADMNDAIYGSAQENVEGGLQKALRLELSKLPMQFAEKFIGKKVDETVILTAADLKEHCRDVVADYFNLEDEEIDALSNDFSYKIKTINRMNLAEINQALFDKMYGEGKITSEEEFRNRIIDDLKKSGLDVAERAFYNDVVTKIMESVKFNLPESFLKRWLMSLDSKNTEEIVERDFAQFADNLRWDMISGKILADNNQNIEEKHLTAQVIKNIKAYGGMTGEAEDEEEDDDFMKNWAKEILSKQEQRDRIVEQVKESRLIRLFKEQLTIDTKKVTIQEFKEQRKK